MGKIKYDKRNYRKHNERNKELIRKSLTECGAGRSVLLDADDSLIAGNGVFEQAEKLGIPVRVIETDGSELIAVKRTDIGENDEKRRRLALADNATSDSSEWDVAAITADLSPLEIEQWDIVLPDPSSSLHLPDADSVDEYEIERKRKEFEQRMANGENMEEDEEYQAFLAKFEEKKTTDDCYTPALIYDAVADWVADRYGLSRADFVRPFYPGGDYQRETYKPGDVVVDNPPFSIMSEILQFYDAQGVRFFLFAPHLTLFSSSSRYATAIPTGVSVIYENGACVNTSFLTNLEPCGVRFMSSPSLYAAVKKADDIVRKGLHKSLPVYSYDKHIVQTPFLSSLSRFGVEWSVTVEESAPVSQLDSQKEIGRAIYGNGYLISDRALAEREKAEREKAEREKAEREKAALAEAYRWDLSPRELAIVQALNEKKGKK